MVVDVILEYEVSSLLLALHLFERYVLKINSVCDVCGCVWMCVRVVSLIAVAVVTRAMQLERVLSGACC